MSPINEDWTRVLVDHWPAIRERAREVHAWYRAEYYPHAGPNPYVEVMLDQDDEEPATPTISCRWGDDGREDELHVAYLWWDDAAVRADIRAQHARDEAEQEARRLGEREKLRELLAKYGKLRELRAKYGPVA